MYSIYEVWTEENKVYVGCTSTSLKKRFACHISKQKPFVMIPHTVKIVGQLPDKESAHKLEAELITKYDSTNPDLGYNRRYGGPRYGFPKYVADQIVDTYKINGNTSHTKGKHLSEETKEKIRQKALARDPSTFEKNRNKTPEQIRKLHEGRDKFFQENEHPNKGKSLSEEQKKAISDSAKGNKRWLGKKHTEETKAKIRETKRLAKFRKFAS